MFPAPFLSSTLVGYYGQEWYPKTFSDFLIELTHLQESIKEAFLYRGQQSSLYLLDSTFSRSLKRLIGIPLINRYPKFSWNDSSLQHDLFLIFLEKMKKIEFSNQLSTLAGKHQICQIFEFHKHRQQNPYDPYFQDFEPMGTNLLDFSYDWRVALFFANHKRKEHIPGALFM